MAFLHNTDFFQLVAEGKMPAYQDYSGSGVNKDVDTGSTPEDIWLAGGVFVPPTTYRIHNIVSASANDTAAGTGARTVRVFGVTVNGLESEVVAMNGVTPVPTTKAYKDIYEMQVAVPGAGNTNAGIITATAVTDATVTATILVDGLNTSRKAIRYIPTGYTGYLYDWNAGMEHATAGNSAGVYLLTKYDGEAWLSRGYHSLSNSGASYEIEHFKTPLVLPADTWVKIQCTSVSANNTLIQGGFNLMLKQN